MNLIFVVPLLTPSKTKYKKGTCKITLRYLFGQQNHLVRQNRTGRFLKIDKWISLNVLISSLLSSVKRSILLLKTSLTVNKHFQAD